MEKELDNTLRRQESSNAVEGSWVGGQRDVNGEGEFGLDHTS